MDREDDLVILTDDAWRRMSATVRDHESRERGSGAGPAVSPTRRSDCIVAPSGVPVEVDTESSMRVDGTSVPAPFVKVVYPGKFWKRSFSEQDNDKWWTDLGRDCWIAEINNQGLWINRSYEGYAIGQLAGRTVFGVIASADPQKLAIVSATPEAVIAGINYWNAAVLMWDEVAGKWTDDVPFDGDVLVFDPDNGGFTFGQEIWAKLTGPVLVGHAYYGHAASHRVGSQASNLWTAFALIAAGGGGMFPHGGSDCPVWSCCVSGCVDCGPNPDDPENDAWLGLPCTPWDFFAAPNSGDPNCGFWSCDGGDTPCESIEDLCGCTDFETAAGCYPFLGTGADAIDLQSTGISLACLFGCRDGQLVVRKACINVIPGGPFGLRPALLAKGNGRELKSPTDGDF